MIAIAVVVLIWFIFWTVPHDTGDGEGPQPGG